MSELLIRNGLLFDHDICTSADILIREGKIAAIGPNLTTSGRVLDAQGKVVMPGFINAHTHSNQALEKGLCDRYPLDAWMVIASYGGANAELTPRDLYVSAQIGAIEMIRTGSTSVLDMPRVDLRTFEAGSNAIMQAYIDIGFRASVAVSYTDQSFPASLPLELIPNLSDSLQPKRTAAVADVIGHLESFIARWKGKHALVTPMVGPSSLPRCSTELFEASVDLCRRCGVGMQTHLLSGKSQVFVGKQRYGGSTVDFIRRMGGLEEWATFAHSIWLDDAEVSMLEQSNAVAVHNPVSNMKLGAGLAPMVELRRQGGRIALGSDGASSADSQNMFETVKGAAILHRINHTPDQWIMAEDALDMVWNGGAAATRQKVGKIAVGYEADLVVLHSRNMFLAPKDQLAGQIVHSELGGSVDSTIVAGEILMLEGKIATIDEAAIHAEAQEIVGRIYAGLPERMKKFEDVRPMFDELERRVHAAPLHFARFCS